MKRTFIITALTLLIVSTFLSSNVFAESLADKYLGERKTCLEIVRIDETQILDDQAILFETDGGAVYISRFPAPCYGLYAAGTFFYRTSISKLCEKDIIEILDEGLATGTTCGLGEFIRIKGVSRLSEAVKLLYNDGVLERLVKEGAFETAFPPEKNK